MKTGIYYLICWLIVSFSWPGFAEEADWFLVKAGKSECAIVIPDSVYEVALPGDRGVGVRENMDIDYAAHFLREQIRKATGVEVPVVKESGAASKYRIYIGPTEEARKNLGDLTRLRPDEFIIKTMSNRVVICGEVSGEKLSYRKNLWHWRFPWNSAMLDRIDRGTLFGVYEFIERLLGVRWYFPGELGTVIPHKEEVAIMPMDIRGKPYFPKRDISGIIDWTDKENKAALVWHPVLRFADVTDSYANHNEVAWWKLYGKTHPEYFALKKDGTRANVGTMPGVPYMEWFGTSLCYSEPEVFKQYIENIEEFDRVVRSGNFGRGKPTNEECLQLWGKQPTPEYIYMGPNEPVNTCYCERCKKFMREDAPWLGQHSEIYFDFVARVANEAKKRWPERRVISLAYDTYMLAPQNVELPDNVDILLCLSAGYAPSLQKEPRVYKAVTKVIEGWYKVLGKDKNRLFIWDYMDNTQAQTDAALLYPHVLSKRFKYYKNRVNGFFVCIIGPYNSEAVKNIPNRINHQSTLLWLWYKLMRDPKLDVDKTLNEFYEGMFGNASRTMQEFFALQIDRWENTSWKEPEGVQLSPERIYGETYPPEVVARLKSLIEKAAGEVSPDSIEYKRIKWYQKNYELFFQGSQYYQGIYGKFQPVDVSGMNFDVSMGETGFGRGSGNEETGEIIFRVDNEVGHLKKGSVFISVSEKKTVGPAECHWPQGTWTTVAIPSLEGVSYKATAWVKTEAARQASIGGFFRKGNQYMANSHFKILPSKKLSGDNDWTELVTVGEAPPGSSSVCITLSVKGASKGVWFDDLSLEDNFKEYALKEAVALRDKLKGAQVITTDPELRTGVENCLKKAEELITEINAISDTQPTPFAVKKNIWEKAKEIKEFCTKKILSEKL